MLFMLEYRATKMLISDQFPDTANSMGSIHVDSDVMSLDGRHPLKTEAEINEDGELQVNVRKSNTSRSDSFSRRPSNLTNAEIYSPQSSGINPTPRGSSFNHTDFDAMMGGARNSNFGANDIDGLSASRGPTPMPSNFEEETENNSNANKPRFYHGENKNNSSNNNAKNTNYPAPDPGMFSPTGSMAKKDDGCGECGKDLHMFVGSSSACPDSDVFGGHDYGALDQHANAEDVLIPLWRG